ncbi:MAG: PAS domain S-box protein [Chloroflexi bacterium]|nr:PAS domain S-box protein [Chloroflexota bacterium]
MGQITDEFEINGKTGHVDYAGHLPSTGDGTLAREECAERHSKSNPDQKNLSRTNDLPSDGIENGPVMLADRFAHWAVLASLMAAVFAIDLVVPLGAAGGAPYIAVILISMGLPGNRSMVTIASLVSILALAGYFFSPAGETDSHVLINRFLSVGLIWAITGLDYWTAKNTRNIATERSTLAELSRIISSAENIETVSPLFANHTKKLIAFDRITIAEVDWERNILVDKFVSGVGIVGVESGATYPLDEFAGEEALRHGESHVLTEKDMIPLADRYKHISDGLAAGLKSAIFVPLRSRNQTIGALILRSTVDDAYKKQDLVFTEQIAAQIAGVIANWQAMQTLETSEKNYRDLVESSHELIWRTDADGRFTYLNPAWERTHGYTVEEMLGRPFSDFAAREIAERDSQQHSDLMAGGYVVGYETRHLSKSGSEVNLLFNAFPATNTDGEIVGVRGTAHDVTEERKAQAGFRVRAAVVEATGDATIVAGTDGIITLANLASEEMFGISREKLVGTKITTLMPVEYRSDHIAGIKRAGEVSPSHILDTLIETNGLRADGTPFPIELRISRIAGDAASSFVATIRDITDRKNLEATVRTRSEALRESEARYRDLFDNAPDMYVSIDVTTGKITECNKSTLNALGYQNDELIGKRVFELNHPDSLVRGMEVFRESQTTGEISDAELTLQRKDGSAIHVSLNVSATRNADGNVIGSQGTMRDITERKRAEEELKIRLAALDTADDMVVITNPQGIVEYVNRAFTAQTGYTLAEMIGGTPKMLKSGRQNPAFYSDLWNTVKSGNVWNGILINRRKDGSEYPEEMSITPVIGEDGELLRYIAIKRNISERLRIASEREAAREMETQNRDLLRGNEDRKEFLSTVSHELRTPLAAMLAFSEILRRNREDNLTAKQLDQLDHITKGGRRLNELIEDLLDVSRADSGRLTVEKAPFEVSAMMDEIVADIRPILDDRGESLDCVGLTRLVWLDADEGRVVQSIKNLLTNASKYSPDNTVVELSVGTVNDRLEIEVRDHGIGISPEDQEQLFSPFFRANNAETRSKPGTGLGLVIVKAIVELHVGEVTLSSQSGKGTTIRFWIPGVMAAPPRELTPRKQRPQFTTSRLDATVD